MLLSTSFVYTVSMHIRNVHHCMMAWSSVAHSGPQTYLQRPSSWGRATAGRQDVMSHVHTAKRKVYSLHSSSRQM